MVLKISKYASLGQTSDIDHARLRSRGEILMEIVGKSMTRQLINLWMPMTRDFKKVFFNVLYGVCT